MGLTTTFLHICPVWHEHLLSFVFVTNTMADVGTPPKKIAFLFLIYDCINLEEAWHMFFSKADPETYVIHIHYKWQKPLQYYEDRKLKNCIETQYVIDNSIARAHNLLIEEAYKDPAVVKTINLSQSCIPFKSFDHVYEALTRDNNSHFNLMPLNSWSVTVIGPATHYVPREEISKAANWFVLNRKHAECCLQHLEYLEYFRSVHSPEEFLYITLLRKYAPEDMVCTDYSAEGATTFTNWAHSDSGMVYKYPVDTSIKSYSQISEEELNYLLSSPCLFGRKFTSDCKVGETPLHECPAYAGMLLS